MKKVMLLDGDIALFKVCFANEEEYYYGSECVLSTNIDKACSDLDSYVAAIKKQLDADEVIVALSDSINYRKEIFPEYKEHRRDKRKPMGLKAVRKYMEKGYNCYIRDTLEADDVLGILMTHPKLVSGYKVIVSIDKDMKSIPGHHYNPDKPDEGIFTSTLPYANWFHMFQTLVGDPADGYKGCPYVGPKKAEKILNVCPEGLPTYQEMWPVVVEAFNKAGLTWEDALVNAQLSRILRWSDYDYTTKQPILWTPEREGASNTGIPQSLPAGTDKLTPVSEDVGIQD